MLWVKVLVPVVLVAAGGTAAVAATHKAAPPTPTANAAVWIDNPPSGRTYAPGVVTVDAHGVADTDISALDLYVDDKKVATDDDLDVDADLVYATFEWKAPVGDHELVVAQVGGDAQRSDARLITIAEGATAAPAPTTSEPGPTTSSTTTTTVDATSSTSNPGATTTEPPTSPAPLPGPVTVPPTPTAPVTAPSPPPRIQRAALSFPGSTPTFYVQTGCPSYTVDVVVTASNTDAVTVIIEGSSFGAIQAATSDGVTYRATLRSGTGVDSDAGSRTVTVTASGRGGSANANAGLVTIRTTCPKD